VTLGLSLGVSDAYSKCLLTSTLFSITL
jgi:hypothetical protein